MKLHRMELGFNGTNSYLVSDQDSTFIIDPGADGEKILAFIQEKNLEVDKIILTHGHFDHIGAVAYIQEKTGAKLFIHSEDKEYLMDGQKNLSYFTGDLIETVSPDSLLEEGDLIGNFRVIHSPGHTPGSICLYNEEEGILFSGDTIFKNGYGRTDFPGGDQQTLFNSIRKLLQLPDETIVLPGHGPSTTIAEFKRYIS
ncbi:MAG TPA: MBL fold metallo-hydrolase [Halanaerobiaceae bacterium]|jgi:hydroxyacylglutathione hydrolase|nr:MBL fold metallo-hydrolase [Bacillota bacterium]HHU91958.1 MBL fold metallo-hydrolase [Halanaerobiaceae bacterium]HOA41331.1 MBL fold metallo-hydrolase [Halanaerobiales bacterium]HPZ63464.1 MBL fold metallo-hydrolase [Halanaerobiales bacterium]HQD04342.1 MBL fold metallo-hydrolase [Halanaerobiales bacterium]